MVSNFRETLEKISQSCTGCQACFSDCHLLEELGLTPCDVAEQILKGQVDKKVSDFILRCDLCGLCVQSCPDETDISAMVIACRQILVERGISNLQIYKVLRVDQDSNFFTVYQETYRIDYRDLVKTQCDTIFFPGCALSSYAPELTRDALSWLKGKDGKVGLLSKCCGLPLFQMGAVDRAEQYTERLWKAVNESRAYRIVTACPGCFKHLHQSKARRNIDVISLYQLMADAGLSVSAACHDKLTVHDSCLDRGGEMGKYVRQIMKNHEIVEMAHSGATTLCCGSGGIVSMIDPELSNHRAEARLAEFSDIKADLCITYCMSCGRRLASIAEPGKVRHLLELVFNRPLDYLQLEQRFEAMRWDE